MKAQKLYDLREATGFASGTDLHEFFEQETGDPSPSGSVEIDAAHAKVFVAQKLAEMAHNSPSSRSEILISDSYFD